MGSLVLFRLWFLRLGWWERRRSLQKVVDAVFEWPSWQDLFSKA